MLKVNVYLIPKETTLKQSLPSWVNSGRDDNSQDGEFIFEFADSAHILHSGVLCVKYADEAYYYNAIDFYRIKIVFVEGPTTR